MTPYYEHAGIIIYHGDCREILPSVSADARHDLAAMLASHQDLKEHKE